MLFVINQNGCIPWHLMNHEEDMELFLYFIVKNIIFSIKNEAVRVLSLNNDLLKRITSSKLFKYCYMQVETKLSQLEENLKNQIAWAKILSVFRYMILYIYFFSLLLFLSARLDEVYFNCTELHSYNFQYYR